MEEIRMKYRTFLSVFTLSCMVFFGCRADDPAPTDTSIPSEAVPANIFPLSKGKRFGFSGYLTSGSTETAVAGSDSLQASWFVVGDTSVASVFGDSAALHITPATATLILDSLHEPGFVSPAKLTPVFVYKDNSSNYYYLTNFGNVFRTYGVSSDTGSAHSVRRDSLNFIKLTPGSAKTGESFTVFNKQYKAYPATFGSVEILLTINIEGKFERKESIAMKLNGKDTTISAYYLTITSISTLGALPPQSAINAKFWLAEGIGPVQMFLAGDTEAPGSFRKLISLQ